MKSLFVCLLLSVAQLQGIAQDSCHRRLVMKIAAVPIYKIAPTDASTDSVVAFKAKFSIDADGSPRAYGPSNNGLDDTANAGHAGNWWGVVTSNGKSNGTPVLQKASDPFP